MVEEEARQDQSSSGEEAADVKMVDQEEHGNPESSGPHMEADTEDNPPWASGGDTISPEEEEILLGGTPQPADHSPRSETASVSGGMAELCLASLPKIVKFIDHYTSGLILLFIHLDNHLYIIDSFCHSLTGWYVLHYFFHSSYRIIWLFRS